MSAAQRHDERPALVAIPLAVLSVSVEHPPADVQPSAVLTQVHQDRAVRVEGDLGDERVHGQRHVPRPWIVWG
jgi:hypothetical protein